MSILEFYDEAITPSQARDLAIKTLQGNTLHLTLKRKWFDMYLQETNPKTEEYRKIKESMVSLLFDWKKSGYSRKRCLNSLKNANKPTSVRVYHKEYDTITFSNGYATDRDLFVIEYHYLSIDTGIPEWGAVEDEKYFVLKTGKILYKNF